MNNENQQNQNQQYPNQQYPNQQYPNQQPYQQPYQQPMYQQPMNGQQMYQQPMYQQPMNKQPVPNPGKGLSIAGLVCGIISAILAWFGAISIVALALGIVGIFCAAKGKAKAREVGAATGLGTAGLVLSIIGTSIAGIGVLSWALCVACVTAGLGELGAIGSLM